MHYKRVRRHGDPGVALIHKVRPHDTCSVEGCDMPYRARGLCATHWSRNRKSGNPEFKLSTVPVLSIEVGYDAVHRRVKRLKGVAANYSCVTCGGAASQWAYDNADSAEIQGSDGWFSLNPMHYQPMCVSCHKNFDIAYSRGGHRVRSSSHGAC